MIQQSLSVVCDDDLSREDVWFHAVAYRDQEAVVKNRRRGGGGLFGIGGGGGGTDRRAAATDTFSGRTSHYPVGQVAVPISSILTHFGIKGISLNQMDLADHSAYNVSKSKIFLALDYKKITGVSVKN